MHNAVAGLGGSLTALVTPFRESCVDWKALCHLTERQIERGTSALIVCGSTGEAASLILPEYSRAVRTVAEMSAGRAPVIVGCTALATAAAVAMGAEAAAAGADALLCAVPPYVKPTQCGIIAHIRAIAHATDLPIVLYDVPSRSGAAISDDTIARLYDAELIVGLKDATADLSRPARLRARCGSAFLQWSGDDATAPAHRAMGGVGCISVTANVAPALCALLHRCWDAGDMARFATLRDVLDPLHAALFNESNPIPVKSALASLGLCTDEMRLPLTRANLTTQEWLLTVMPTVMLAEEHAAHQPVIALAS
ncbi:MAG TPA: 4-hydroxy-tetrahydrodipicolinate synthase [Acetobacteraceae bacterium]|nr:4-hydroxy-tetrahydrodipicolinate synthase [Acetobacteraceae bacterium]